MTAVHEGEMVVRGCDGASASACVSVPVCMFVCVFVRACVFVCVKALESE